MALTKITNSAIADDIGLGGNPTTSTQTAGDSTTRIATTAFVSTAVANLVDSAPDTLNTLAELATSIGNNATLSSTLTSSIATKLPLAGGTLTGNLNLGDNVRARFGTDNDLQIYHDGSNAQLVNSTGALFTQGTVKHMAANGSDYMATFNSGGSVELYHNTSVKLATTSTGIDVTGNVTIPTGNKIAFDTDGLTYISEDIDERLRFWVANTEFMRMTNTTTDELRLLPYGGNLFAGGNLDVTGNIGVSGTVDGIDIAARDAVLTSTTTTAGAALPKAGGTLTGNLTISTGSYPKLVLSDTTGVPRNFSVGTNNETFTIRNETAGSDAFTIDNANNATFISFVDIPSRLRHSGDGDNYIGFGTDIQSFVTGNSTRAQFSNTLVRFNQEGLNQDFQIFGESDNNLFFADASTDRIGIGTDSPTMPLSVKAATNAYAINMHGRSDGYSELYGSSSDGSTKYAFLQTHSAQTKLYTLVNTPLLFGTNSTERMRIDSLGNVLFGNGNSHSPKIQGTTNSGRTPGSPGYSFNDDLDTGMFQPVSASNTVAFSTGGTERMRIDSSGTVKISHADTASEGLRVIQTTAARTSGGALGLFYDDQAGTTQPTLKVIQNGTGDILQLFDGANQVVTVEDGGNVGIGTSSPLSLDGNAAPGLTVSSNGPYILLQDANNSDKVRYISNNTGEFQFGIVGDNGISGKTEHMRIDTSGKILIGDSASHTSDLLQIETPASGGGHGIQIRRNDSNTDQGVGRIQFGNNTATDLASISAKTDGATDNAALLFNTSVSGGANTERMRIDANGHLRFMSQGAGTQNNASINNHTNNYMYFMGGTSGAMYQADNTGAARLRVNTSSIALETAGAPRINIATDGATTLSGLTTVSSGYFNVNSGSGGGQIGLGDNSNSNPIGISEGLWNTVGSDNDYISVYARNSFNIRGYSGGTTHWLSLTNTNMVLQQNQKLQAGSFKPIVAGTYSENHIGVYVNGMVVNAQTSQTGWLMSAGSGRLSWDTNGLQTTGDVKINESAAATDFKVSTDNRSHMINVVGSNDEVRIGSRKFLNPVSAFYISSGTLNRNLTISLNNCGEYYLKIMLVGLWPYQGSSYGTRIIEVTGFGSANHFTVIRNTHYGSGPTGSVVVSCASSTLNVAITTAQNYRWEANCEIIQGGGGMSMAVDGTNA